MRRNESDERREIPASGWAYVNAREIELLPRGTKPETGSLYEFHYPATNPIVLGAGMAAVRDFVSFLRYETRAKGPRIPAGTRSRVRWHLALRRALAFCVTT